jgi:hypothetical protein
MSARMLAEWRKKTRGSLGVMTDPTQHKETFDMWKNNRAYQPFQVGILANWLGMKKHPSIEMNYNAFETILDKYGPIWAAGNKHWAGGHNHVVVVFGVSDTGVLINDPEPMNVGTEVWKTWDSFKKYITGVKDCDCNFLTCP